MQNKNTTKIKKTNNKRPKTANKNKNKKKVRYNKVNFNVKADKAITSSHEHRAILPFAKRLIDPTAPPVRFPLSAMGRTHLKTVKYRLVKTVNATGNLIFVLPPSLTTHFATTSAISPLFCCNSNTYNPSINTNNFVGETGLFDVNFTGVGGTNLDNNTFASSACVSLNLKVSLTGVSNLNKKGKIYIIEGRNNLYYGGGAATEPAAANEYTNRYYLGNLTKYQFKKEIEIMNMDSKNRIEYSYIPECSYSNLLRDNLQYPTLYPSGPWYMDRKAVVVVVIGADPSMEVQFDLCIDIQARPKPSYLNTYPTDNINIFVNPDPILRQMECDPDCVLRADNSNDIYARSTAKGPLESFLASMPIIGKGN